MILSRSGLAALWKTCCLTALVALAGSMSPAHAHPHVTIENRSDVVLNEQGQIVAINVEWKFDDMYSLAAVEGLDTNGDGEYTPDEIKEIATENIEALKEYDYFVDAKVNGQKIAFGHVTEYGNLFSKGILTMYFRVPLKEPVDPKAGAFSFAVYDPSYYIAIELPEADPIQVIGTLPEACRIDIGKSAAETENFQYTEEFWENDAKDGMGAIFARPIAIKCDGAEKQASNG